MLNVLFLCTGNSARSIMAEAILNKLGEGRFKAYSAGSRPTGRVNPLALATLERKGLPTQGFRSKSWDEFAKPDAPPIHLMFAVCDAAAAEACPIWPGRPMTAHWGVPDPVGIQGSEEARLNAFNDAFVALHRRIAIFIALPMEKIDSMAMRKQLAPIDPISQR